MFTSLRERMGLLFAAFFLLVSTSVVASVLNIRAQTQDAVTINLAGRQRMLIQQMTANTLLLARNHDPETVSVLEAAIRAFDETLYALFNGGQVVYPDNRIVTIPPPPQPEIEASLLQLAAEWTSFQTQLHIITTPSSDAAIFTTAVARIERHAPELIRQADSIARLYEMDARQKVDHLRAIQVAFLLAALLLVAVGSRWIQTLALTPLRELITAAERIGEGDLITAIPVRGPTEIARLTRSLDTMRHQLATAQAERLVASEELEARVLQRTAELTALHEISREISSRLDIQHVLQSVTSKAHALFGADVACLCLLDDTHQRLMLATIQGPPVAVAATTASASDTLPSQVLSRNEALPCGANECAAQCRIVAASFRASHLAAPLRVGNHLVGALCVASQQPRAFSTDHPTLLTKLAYSAAIALDNARLYAQAERAAILEERQRIAAEMHDGLAQTLSYVMLKAERVVELVETGQNDQAVNDARHVRAATWQASQEARQAIASLLAAPLPPQSLQDCLTNLAHEFGQNGGPEVALAASLSTPLYLLADQTEPVLHVVREAVLNARRHARAERIVIRVAKQGPEVMISIEDDGVGFDPAASQMAPGHFGLSIMRTWAERLQGRFIVDSSPGQGTRVILTYPLSQATHHRAEGATTTRDS